MFQGIYIHITHNQNISVLILIYITRYMESFHFQLRQPVNTHDHTSHTVLIDIHHTLFGIFPFPVKTAEKHTRSH